VASEELKARRAARARERPDRYRRRRRPRVDPLAWGRFRVRVRGVLPWKRLLASLNRSRNLSPAVLLGFLAIFDSFRRDGHLGRSRAPLIHYIYPRRYRCSPPMRDLRPIGGTPAMPSGLPGSQADLFARPPSEDEVVHHVLELGD
jgi:hypothetical protein